MTRLIITIRGPLNKVSQMIGPRSRMPDATLAMLREGYVFVGRRCDQLGSDLFLTCILGVARRQLDIAQ